MSSPLDDLFKDIVSEREYHAKELNTMFDRWHNNRLKKEAFPQYAELEAQSEPLEYENLWDCEADEDSAYNELFGMVSKAANLLTATSPMRMA